MVHQDRMSAQAMGVVSGQVGTPAGRMRPAGVPTCYFLNGART